MDPFLKWAGGKRRLLKEIVKLLPPDWRDHVYHEPMIGAGAVFFSLCPGRSVICDANPDLIHVYTTVRDRVEELIDLLRGFKDRHEEDPESYYGVRTRFNLEKGWDTLQAARFVYLNRTCFNGLYRVNKSGAFNVPLGRYKNPKIVQEERLREASKLLRSAAVMSADFTVALDCVTPGDFVYFDPPYKPVSDTSNFTAFTANGFGEDDQIRLAEHANALVNKGCRVLLSNSDHPSIHALYSDHTIRRVKARRSISADADARGYAGEVLICAGYEPPE